jgi:hypothetical protein
MGSKTGVRGERVDEETDYGGEEEGQSWLKNTGRREKD